MMRTDSAVAGLSLLLVTGILGCENQALTGAHSQAQVQQAQREERWADHFDAAVGYEARGQFDLAKDEYRQAIRERPDDSRAYVNLGRLHAREGDEVRAQALWQKAIEVNPGDALGYNLLGGVSMRQKKYSAAIAYYKSAVDRDPNYANSHWNLAAVYRSLEMKQKAGEHYRRFIELAGPEEAEDMAEAKRYVEALDQK